MKIIQKKDTLMELSAALGSVLQAGKARRGQPYSDRKQKNRIKSPGGGEKEQV